MKVWFTEFVGLEFGLQIYDQTQCEIVISRSFVEGVGCSKGPSINYVGKIFPILTPSVGKFTT